MKKGLDMILKNHWKRNYSLKQNADGTAWRWDTVLELILVLYEIWQILYDYHTDSFYKHRDKRDTGNQGSN